MASKCKFPTFNFAFNIGLPGLPALPSLPVFVFSLSLYCPLD